MADYTCVSRTSYFRVKDEEEFRKVVSFILADVDVWEQVDENGVKRFAIGGYDNMTIFKCTDNEDPEFYQKFGNITETDEAIQLCLPEGEVAIMFEVGHEKLRYVVGWCCLITPGGIRYLDLSTWAAEMCEQLGVPIPQMEY